MAELEDQAVTNFREYLRIKTVHPSPDYDGAVVFLTRMANELKLPYRIILVHPDRPVFLMTWEGTQPNLPSILLNSHTDVVPVFPEYWTHEPFSAHKDESGNIYARGTQDMKCVGNQYIEVLRRLRTAKKTCPRTVHLCFVPDEVVGSHLGMALFIKTEEFKSLNVGFAFDEGLANTTDAFTVFYGERSPWWIQVTCKGDPGHGSRFIENSAAEKFSKVVNSFLQLRESEKARLKSNPGLCLGDVTTCNLNMVEGGVQLNVVPAEMKAYFDIRVATTVDLLEFEQRIKQWCEEAGSDVNYQFIQKNTNQKVTSISDTDPWWNAFSTTAKSLGLKLETEIFPAFTDSRLLRELDIPALGFSPINNTPILLNNNNEFLNEDVYLKGIEYYMHFIEAMASVPQFKSN